MTQTSNERADAIAASILDRLKQSDDWPLMASIIAKKLEMAAWNHTFAPMLAGNKNCHPHYQPPEQPESD